jgi:hypothetical protein
MARKNRFSFEISLSVLNHLGRNLYRSFVTVLGEAISNSWDADARNVWIYVDKDVNRLVVKDDGIGMTEDDFQSKFLKIGYSKRGTGKSKSPGGRPYIGRKGIGKLALLSCASRISVISKTTKSEYVGGLIDNSGLDKAITDDLTPKQYPLMDWDKGDFAAFTKGHRSGTIICFDQIKGGIKNSLGLLRKVLALYFRFSLIDKSFNVFVDDKKIDFTDLAALSQRTEFLWTINELKDPFMNELTVLKKKGKLKTDLSVTGFVASVSLPRDLNIMNMEERVSVDLFVNGRLREKNLLKHIPTARIVEDYLYGQIHFNDLDDAKDRFTSDREGIVADDSKYTQFLQTLKKKVIAKIIDQWDEWRIAIRKPGDSENPRMSSRERKSKDLFDDVSRDYGGTDPGDKVDEWINSLSEDARFNFSSYAECFVSENLIRVYIKDKKVELSKESLEEIEKWKRVETDSKNKGNISIEIRGSKEETRFLSMNDLAYLVDMDKSGKHAALSRDADQYKPIRDAVAHTSRLTDKAKEKLTTVYENIRGRLKSLLATVK